MMDREVCYHYMLEDFGYEGYGVVHCLHCSDCHAEVEYRVPVEEDAE